MNTNRGLDSTRHSSDVSCVSSIKERLNEKKRFKISEVNYFHPAGLKTIPNGHPIQKGGFFKECRDNKNKFKVNNNHYVIKELFQLVPAIDSKENVLSDCSGGIVLLPTSEHSLERTYNKLFDWIMEQGKTLVHRFFTKAIRTHGGGTSDGFIGALSIGYFFSGKYVADNEMIFDENAVSIEVNGISSQGLVYLATEIAREFNQKTVLVKDFNADTIMLVNEI